MANRRCSSLESQQNRRDARRKLRRLLSETLEDRRLLTVGPQLIGIQPNASDLLNDGDVRSEAPNELVFRFDQSQSIDASTLEGIRITAAGGDGTFGLATIASDFGSQGAASILLTAGAPDTNYQITVQQSDLGAGGLPQVSRNGSNVDIVLNSASGSLTTASELINAINSSSDLQGHITARLLGGLNEAELGTFPNAIRSPMVLVNTQDRIITPGATLVSDSATNEVVVRFASQLEDDNYRIEVFGFDDPNLGVTGLRNAAGDLFQPSSAGTRLDQIDFRLDLGPRVVSVVPQPVVRVNGQLQQQRDQIVVYFDDAEKLLVENNSLGEPTRNSVEHPSFYKLIYTAESVRNTDDLFFAPQDVQYNAHTNSATLTFISDIDALSPTNASTFRLRIGTRESAPMAPVHSEAAATAISDFNTNGAAKFRFTSRALGEDAGGIDIRVTNSNSGAAPVITSNAGNKTIDIDLGSTSVTAGQLLAALQTSSAATNLVSIRLEPGSDPNTVLNAPINYSPISVVGLGSSFDTSTDLGVIGSTTQTQTSLILSSAIDPKSFNLDLPGANDDAAHRQLINEDSFEGHVNPAFGADSTAGITTIYYNFRSEYSTDASGNPLTNAISDDLKQRTREVLALWSNYVGVQFVETAESGLTFALGQFNGLRPRPNTQLQREPQLGFVTRIDPTFNESLIIMSANNDWGTNYGDDYTRTLAAAVGMTLGLQHAGDLPETTLMRLDPRFLGGSEPLTDANDMQLTASDERFEPIFPGNQDILHGQYLYRPDSNDVDLFRFEVDFGGSDQVGVLTAETYAQRLSDSSPLNTNLELFRQTQAAALTNFGGPADLKVDFEAVADGPLGNQLQIILTQTDRNDGSAPRIQVFPNAISVDLNSNPSSLTTVQEVVDALTNSAAASRLVKVTLSSGDGATEIGANDLPQNPIVLSGGKIELVSQNDDYFSKDSLVKQSLTSGVYYIGVSASGNNDFKGTLDDGGFGGQSQGEYDLRITFRAEVDTSDTIRDLSGGPNDIAVSLDGDSDGQAGGNYDFWFQTKPLNRVVDLIAGASAELEGQTLTVVGGNGVTRTFEFDSDASIQPGRIAISYSPFDSAGTLADMISTAINSRPELGVNAQLNGNSFTLIGERSIAFSAALPQIDVQGKTIFVDKAAGPNADGSLANPFNNIAGNGVANAFSTTHPGDIVRIVGNGGIDNDPTTIGDNLAYEIGIGLLPGSTLSDGASMNVPLGVTAMVDAGAIFKLRQAAINVGSTNVGINRSGSTLQVLGTPLLTDVDSNPIRDAGGSIVPGSVYFTSWLDESLGLDTYQPTTTAAPGDWGGISFQQSIDRDAGRTDLEDEGIFLRYINHADIRYGGGSVVVDASQATVNSIQLLDARATVTENIIQFGADAAMSALPNSFQETNFHEPRYQAAGAFTSDYDRVGPEIHHNTLLNNSLNGLFIKVDTPADADTRTLTVPGRFDDTDVVHLVSENLVVTGSPGGALLDSTSPDVGIASLVPTRGGTLSPGDYNYKITFVDRNGYESIPSNPTGTLSVDITADAVRVSGLPAATGDFVGRRIYRSSSNGSGPYTLIASMDRNSTEFLDLGGNLGGMLTRDRADVQGVSLTDLGAGTLAAGVYSYRLVMVDAAGREGLASSATMSLTVGDNASIQINGIPDTLSGYVGRRLYRSAGIGQPYRLVGDIANGASSFTDDGSSTGNVIAEESLGVRRPRLNASLVIDPGTVLKLESSRIEATFGATIIAEGVDGNPIVFTSKHDDTVGAGGTFDTNNNSSSTSPSPRDWGGIYMAPTSSLSVDYARFAYGGGVTKMGGTLRSVNTIEIQQADARIANSLFENNADGFGGQGPGTRFGRLSNARSTIFVRGSQPTLIGNTFVDNAGNPIEIDVLSMDAELRSDPGRQTGSADQVQEYSSNRGPLIRGNQFDGNDLNGLMIRAGEILTSASVWDDTDIVHVVKEEIIVSNVQHEGGLRLQSAPSESLVVKFDGYGSNFNDLLGAGLTAQGELINARDRVGGTIHIAGQPGFPVILTSLADDTVGAGLKPDGSPQTDTNADGIASIPQAGDWRGIFLDQYSNDRNVIFTPETESPTAAAPGPNGSVGTPQVLGDLASRGAASSESRSLGFVVEGVLSQTSDVDVYSFSGAAGTEVWFDVDYTSPDLDLLIELLDANGQVLARSNDSTAEAEDPSLLYSAPSLAEGSVNPLPRHLSNARQAASGAYKEDGTTNHRDPGMRVLLPGSAGTRSNFFFRIRSVGKNIDDVRAGLTSGSYQAQVRLQEAQEYAGSSINYADIRYAMNGVHLKGLPSESPLIGEAQEDESVRDGALFAANDVATGGGRGFAFSNSPIVGVDRIAGNRPQFLGNVLSTSLGGFSVAGELSSSTDLDFYMLEVSQEDVLQGINGLASVVFDIDYADGLNRPDTSLNIFVQEPSNNPNFDFQYRLLYSGDGSNIAEDQPRPLSGTDMEDLSRGSAGTRDAYIGPVALAQGTYLVGVSSAAYQPRAKVLTPDLLEPIQAIQRVVDTNFVLGRDGATPPVVSNFLTRTDVGATNELVSADFDLGDYSADDLPSLYLTYTHGAGDFEIFVADAGGAETLIATTQNNFFLPDLLTGTNNLKIGLEQFAGQDGLSLIFRSTDPTTNIDDLVIGFAERGESLTSGDELPLLPFAFIGQNGSASTRVFSLDTYSFQDDPDLEFTYDVQDGNLDVFVVDQFGNATRVATTDGNNAGPGEVVLVGGAQQQALIDISRWVGEPGLTVLFAARNDDPTNIFIQNVFVSLADGSRIHSGEPNPTYVQVPVSSGTITSGKYQLEVRTAESFFDTSFFGGTVYTSSFDTNDRFATQTTLTAPAGSELVDGDVFTLSDGGSQIGFEFTTDASVQPGNVPVRFTASDAAHVVAQRIRDAINNPNVQSRFGIRAATSNGFDGGTSGQDEKINLFGNAVVDIAPGSNLDGKLDVTLHTGFSDSNLTREQSIVKVQNSFIRESRDYGVWSEPAEREFDPRDVNQIDIGFGFGFNVAHNELQDKPNLVGVQAVRNLPLANNSVEGGLLPGLVIENNILEEGGLGGVLVQGETPIWMLTAGVPYNPPTTAGDPTTASADFNPYVNNQGNNPPPSHFGHYIDDQDTLVVDVERTRLRFEFDDLAGGATGLPVAGSGQVEGNGYAADSTVAWYRDTGGAFYRRSTGGNPALQPFATTGLETIHALRDSILGSILVTNGTTQTIKATVADSLLGPDPTADLVSPFGSFFGDPLTGELTWSSYGLYHNQPALYLEGVSNLQWQDGPNGYGFNPFDTRQLALGEAPQPHARIVNNTIVGKDGRASFNGETPIAESNDTISDAVQTWQGTAHNPLFYSDVGVIGDGGVTIPGATGGSAATGSDPGGGTAGGGGGASFLSGQLLLKFNPDVSQAERTALLASENLEVVKSYDFLDALLVRPSGHSNVINRVDQLNALPEIKYAEPDYLREFQRTPNDPQYPQQWHYHNTGQTGGRVDADIDLPEAWDVFTGSDDVVIAVVDSGVDYNHADLQSNMWVNPGEIPGDGLDNDLNGYVDDVYGIDSAEGDGDPLDTDGHGTHVAGTTAATGNNGTGVTGVNWNSNIMALKVGLDSGGIPSSAVIEAMNYMVMMKTSYGVNIVVSNNSYGGAGSSQIEQDAIQATIDAGIPFVAAAGNSSLDNDVFASFPANYPLDGIISVAATDHNDQLAGFSNFGATSVDLAAPGVDVLSTTLGGGYGLLSGTSMASPHVAGVVAMLAGANPQASIAEIKSAILLGADPLSGLDGSNITGARLNAAKSLLVLNAGAGVLSSTDVDIYQFKLGVGERVIVDVDSANSGLDSVLQIFDARGVAQEFVNAGGARMTISDNDAAPGENVSLDPFADFTATQPGVYYAAVSSTGNENFDPRSFAGRTAGNTTGAYRITVSARHLQDFVITAQDASAYSPGDTFTIFGVPDIDSTGSSGRTFEFVFGLGGPTNPNNIPINIGADWRFPDVAVAIARAINEGGTGRGPAITNEQRLPNGELGLADPLPPVYARATNGISGIIHADFNGLDGDKDILLEELGRPGFLSRTEGYGEFEHIPDAEIERVISGPIYEVNQGLRLFPRRNDGNILTVTTSIPDGTFTNIHTLSHLGIGHDRESTQPLSHTSRGDGASEKHIVVKNAAWIDGNSTIIVDPDEGADNNLDQLLPETGVLASRGASPTLLNNVFFNLQTPVISPESRINENTGIVEPFGTDNPNVVSKPGQAVITGSIYQYYETQNANLRFGTGIEESPTNVPNTSLDLNFDIPNGQRLFVNAQAGQYLPAPGSPLIDSAVDSLPERPALAAVKNVVGIPTSSVIAPAYDLVGQLRSDDPSVSPPGGQGGNVFKDRGALDRADFEGPAAILLNPTDNDSLGVDQDSSVSVVQLIDGVYPQFRIQLLDGNEPSNPLLGLGIDDPTVVNSTIPGLRAPGASLVIFENGRLLEEGVDYSFAYNETRDEIILTPLAGVWKNGAVYDMTLNNKDRFVLVAPGGDQVADGETFTIVDSTGGVSTFEFESGYHLQIPNGLTMQIPLAGGGNGGIVDGDRFTINAGGIRQTFEFDRNGNTLGANIPIPFDLGNNQDDIANLVTSAIQNSALPVTAQKVSSGEVAIGAGAGATINTEFSVIDQPVSTLALQIPAIGPRPGGVTDGQTFTISDGRNTVTFEYDNDGSVQPNNTAIDISTALVASDVTAFTVAALSASPINANPTIVGANLIYLGLRSGSVDASNTTVATLGVARTITDGENFSISTSAGTATFEFDLDGQVASGNIGISITQADSAGVVGDKVEAAINSAGLALSPNHVGDGNIAIGGEVGDIIDVSSAPRLTLSGTPGVQLGTRLEVVGPLLLNVPLTGGGGLVDNTTFTISDGNQIVTFEFDDDFSGPSAPTNVVIPFQQLDIQNTIADLIVNAINGSVLNITATNNGSGRVGIGSLATNQVNLQNSNLSLSRGTMSDGEYFTISSIFGSATFEYEDASINNGFDQTRTPIFFTPATTEEELINATIAAIIDAGIGLTPTSLPGGILVLNDTAQFATDISGAPSLRQSGVPGGANPVRFIADHSFTQADMKQAILAAIQNASNTSMIASDRGGPTLFVENVISVSPNIENFFLQGVADLAGNLLKPNRINDETQFTILMPGVELDYGDAPDPQSTTLGRYPTQAASNGARHVISSTALLGPTIDAESDGQPTPAADGDIDDGVVFGVNLNQAGVFNPNIVTTIDVTLSSSGFVDAWIDFNADGDWDDPGEKILDSVRFSPLDLTQSFSVTVPPNVPAPSVPTTTFARFRSSSVGGLTPTGLATDGEVEDYAVTIIPGSPPVAVNDSYTVSEDGVLITNDATGNTTPSFTIDDGIAANDTDADGGTLAVAIVSPPQNAANFSLNPDGTFLYQPAPNFFGIDTFTYRVNDGLLESNNIGTVTITVSEVNDAPVAADDQVTIDEDAPLDVDQSVLLANDSAASDGSESGQALLITSVDPVSSQGGTVTLQGGRVVYTPPENFSGTDTFVYTVTDNGTTGGVAAPLSDSATVTVTVLDKNDAPIPGGDSISTTEDTSTSVAIAQLLANDVPGPADESGQTVSFVDVLPSSSNGGTVVVNGTDVVYTPPANFAGTDTFFYRVVDNGFSNGVSDPAMATGTVTVSVAPVNDAPTVSSPFGEITMIEDESARVIDLSTVFTDPDVATNGDTITYVVISNSNTGLVTPNINGGQLELQLVADQNGQATIVVSATDAANASVTDTLTLTVTPVNDAPRLAQALPDVTVDEDATDPVITLSPQYFFDPDVTLNGDVLTFNVISNSNPLLVTPVVSGNQLTLGLNANQSGLAVISVSATDSSGQSINDTFNLLVNPIDDPPITTEDAYIVPQGQTLTTTDPFGQVGGPENDGVLANDSDPEGGTMTAVLVDPPQFASVFALNSNGTFTYGHDFAEGRVTDTFTYRASDGNGQSAITTVTIEIGAPPPPPHQNPIQNLDVNADGFVTPIDALLIVNYLNNNPGSGSVANVPAPPPYRDVNGDNFVTAVDALIVINALNQQSGGGEGEAMGGGEYLVGTYDLGSPVSSNDGEVSRFGDNARIGMRMLPAADVGVYGPLLPSEDVLFGALGGSDDTWADTSWVDGDDEQQDDETDRALDSLLGEDFGIV